MRRHDHVSPVAVAVLAISTLTACELEEITVVSVDDVVIAEVYVNLAQDPSRNEVRGFVHRTVGASNPNLDVLADVSITVTRSDGLAISLRSTDFDDCVRTAPEDALGACFVADPLSTQVLSPGDVFEVRVDLAGGRRIFGTTQAPGTFEVDDVPATCRLEPNVLMPLSWSRAAGAWAYLNETSIRGLEVALATEGIEVEDDPLYLFGLSVSEVDTTIVFPSEFGLFDRFGLSQDLALRLQDGLPVGTTAEVTITAVDRNYVNWARGGRFNPSGQVRVPSLRGDGTGVFGATVVRRLEVVTTSDLTIGLPGCQSPPEG